MKRLFKGYWRRAVDYSLNDDSLHLSDRSNASDLFPSEWCRLYGVDITATMAPGCGNLFMTHFNADEVDSVLYLDCGKMHLIELISRLRLFPLTLLLFFSRFVCWEQMGKRKPRTAMSGLSRFVTALNQGESEAQPSKSMESVDLAVSVYEQNDLSANEATGELQPESTSTPTLVSVESKQPAIALLYDATSLVPTYTHESTVPDHLKKCLSTISAFFKKRKAHNFVLVYSLCRLFPANTIFFVIRQAAWVPSR
jgi:hypothetical protein